MVTGFRAAYLWLRRHDAHVTQPNRVSDPTIPGR
jgi:hypothetical protein